MCKTWDDSSDSKDDEPESSNKKKSCMSFFAKIVYIDDKTCLFDDTTAIPNA